MTRPHYIPIAPLETLRLPNPRPNWQGCDLAEIELGQLPDGRWTCSVAAHLSTIGLAGPLGYWSDNASPLAFHSRDAALSHAAERMQTFADRQLMDPQAKLIVDWARGLLTFQGDLFALAA